MGKSIRCAELAKILYRESLMRPRSMHTYETMHYGIFMVEQRTYGSKSLSGFWAAFGVSGLDFGALDLDGGLEIVDTRGMGKSTEAQPAGFL